MIFVLNQVQHAVTKKFPNSQAEWLVSSAKHFTLWVSTPDLGTSCWVKRKALGNHTTQDFGRGAFMLSIYGLESSLIIPIITKSHIATTIPFKKIILVRLWSMT